MSCTLFFQPFLLRDGWRKFSGKLKLKCGSQFTSKMEGMMNDLAIGGDHEAAFSAYLKDGQESRKIDVAKIDFNVQV